MSSVEALKFKLEAYITEGSLSFWLVEPFLFRTFYCLTLTEVINPDVTVRSSAIWTRTAKVLIWRCNFRSCNTMYSGTSLILYPIPPPDKIFISLASLPLWSIILPKIPSSLSPWDSTISYHLHIRNRLESNSTLVTLPYRNSKSVSYSNMFRI